MRFLVFLFSAVSVTESSNMMSAVWQTFARQPPPAPKTINAHAGEQELSSMAVKHSMFGSSLKKLVIGSANVVTTSITGHKSAFFPYAIQGNLKDYWVREFDVLNDACLLGGKIYGRCTRVISDTLRTLNKSFVRRGREIREASEVFLFGLKMVRDWEDELIDRTLTTSTVKTDSRALTVILNVLEHAAEISETGDDVLVWTKAYKDTRFYQVNGLLGGTKDKEAESRPLLSFAESILMLDVIGMHNKSELVKRVWEKIKRNSLTYNAQTGFSLIPPQEKSHSSKSQSAETNPVTFQEAMHFAMQMKRTSISVIEKNFEHIMKFLEDGADIHTWSTVAIPLEDSEA